MSTTPEMLFAFLRDLFYFKPNANLDVEKLEPDYVLFGKALVYFAHCFSQYNDFAKALAKGDLSMEPPPTANKIAAPLKSLHASLKHLTWQSKQVAKGDYKQRIDFMGEFSEAFNTMVEQLAERQEKLEDEVKGSQRHSNALEQINLLLSSLTDYIPQQIFVVSSDNNRILLINNMAKDEVKKDPDYLKKLLELLPKHKNSYINHFEVQLNQNGTERYLAVNSYYIEWHEKNATALVINDNSVEKKQIKQLEDYAYYDSMTHVYNRFYGMLTLNEWLDNKNVFALIFVDMDRLKYINDKFGHGDGDMYIINVVKHLCAFSENAIVCRIGGDEFMVLMPDISEEAAHNRMKEIQTAIQNDDDLKDKSYTYSISYGIIVVEENNELSSSNILSIADERMYENKRAKKRKRLVK